MASTPERADVDGALEHYEKLFPRQERLDLEAAPAPDDAAIVEAAARAAEPELRFTWSEAHRHACEVRYVQGLRPDAREAYLQGVAKVRGAIAERKLLADVLKT